MNEINTQTALPVGVASRPVSITPEKSEVQPIARIEALARDPENREQKEPANDPFEALGEALSEFLGGSLNDLKLQIDLDEGAGRFVYKSVNRDTGEVVRQFPSDEILRILSNFRDATGLTVDVDA